MPLKSPKELWSLAQERFFDQDLPWVRDLVYQGRTIKGVVQYGAEDSFKGADSFGLDAQLLIAALEPGGVSQVDSGDEFQIEFKTWVVLDAAKSADGLRWKCRIARRAR